ncbi:hypothetical protein G9400_06740 [Klebsiella michiganensis]|nr:hypothetical protein [Klebsiella michiganensis]
MVIFHLFKLIAASLGGKIKTTTFQGEPGGTVLRRLVVTIPERWLTTKERRNYVRYFLKESP